MTVEGVVKVMKGNADNARRLVKAVIPVLGQKRPLDLSAERALDFAIITAPEKRDPALVAKLDAVAGRVLNKA